MADNSEQHKFWNGDMGESWVRVEHLIDRMLMPLTEQALDQISDVDGLKILDVGCGCGTTSLMLAGKGAHVHGVDISAPMIRRARSKSGQVRFDVGDAATSSFPADYDLVFSRFGIMFFADPVAAFSNLGRALKHGGRLTGMVWQAPASNPWISVVGQALQTYQPENLPQPGPDDPGPFSLADPAKTRKIFNESGFRNIEILPLEADILLGETIDDALGFQEHVGPLSGLLKTLEEDRHEEVTGVVKSVLEPYVGTNGVSMHGRAWLVVAEFGK